MEEEPYQYSWEMSVFRGKCCKYLADIAMSILIKVKHNKGRQVVF